MNINWTQPITVYELIAIALSTIALIIPLIKYIYKHRLTRAHREKQLKMSCQALHNAPPNRT